MLVYFGALAVGIFISFYLSKLAMVSLYSIIGVETAAKLHFSGAALIQTLLVFAAIYALIWQLRMSISASKRFWPCFKSKQKQRRS
ncbi:hypothetical protein [Shouchella clausii]|uniref:Uncharacterized protein n=1 Tax=Shouchella clausii TaxID=79880 RepID=A0A268NZ76_SHOCL|nr:hypothetical protein [Shouchella clausii]PAE88804.1 hypothetical protein CHH72_10535 [Shouchella clausii]